MKPLRVRMVHWAADRGGDWFPSTQPRLAKTRIASPSPVLRSLIVSLMATRVVSV
jgi:hypothetical protein